MIPEIRIYDREFGHAKSMSGEQVPKLMKWRREGPPTSICFFTDRELEKARDVDCEFKVAWLIEPRATIGDSAELFNCVLTYNRKALDDHPRNLFYPHGGCWIPDLECRDHPKTGHVSMISSSKSGLPGYDLRHQVFNNCKSVDFYGTICGKPMISKVPAIAPYHYSIVIESLCIEDYFTEKLIDCFALGTIPIYWGTKNIGKYFDMGGIIQVSSLEEIEAVIENLAEPSAEMLSAVRKNMLLANHYKCVEDWIFSNHQHLSP